MQLKVAASARETEDECCGFLSNTDSTKLKTSRCTVAQRVVTTCILVVFLAIGGIMTSSLASNTRNAASQSHRRKSHCDERTRTNTSEEAPREVLNRLVPAYISANDHYEDQTPESAFDGNVSTKWFVKWSKASLVVSLPPGQVATLTRFEFNMSEEDWSTRWPGSIVVYGYNVSTHVVWHTDSVNAWTRLWSTTPHWNGTTGIAVRPNMSATSPSPQFNAFKFEIENRFPEGEHGDPQWGDMLSVHEVTLFGLQPQPRPSPPPCVYAMDV